VIRAGKDYLFFVLPTGENFKLKYSLVGNTQGETNKPKHFVERNI